MIVVAAGVVYFCGLACAAWVLELAVMLISVEDLLASGVPVWWEW